MVNVTMLNSLSTSLHTTYSNIFILVLTTNNNFLYAFIFFKNFTYQTKKIYTFTYFKWIIKHKFSQNLNLTPEVKLSIILIVYLVQWFPSCLIWMIQSLCNCVPNDVSTVTYWLTFTVALTDLNIINSNYH